MAKFSTAIAVPNITALKSLNPSDGDIRKVDQLDATYAYPSAFFEFIAGASYTERPPGIVADNGATGFWVMSPQPLILSTVDAFGTADVPGALWVNTVTGARFVSNPDLTWSGIASSGGSGYTTTTSGYTQPSVGSTVTINVDSSELFSVGQYVFVSTAGNYEVTGKPGPTQLEIKNTGQIGNVAPATVIATSQIVSPSGSPGSGGIIDPMTTRGDLIYRNPSNTIDRLGAGTAGQVLTSDGTDISWQDATGATNLAYTASPTNGIVTSDTGTDATLTLATGTNAGLMTPADFTKLGFITATGAVNLDNLGTAAFLDVGTSASNVVQLDGTAKLPAVDGSALLNLPSGFADPMTTAGDIIYRNPSNITDRLGKGTDGHVLTSTATGIEWAAPSGGGGDYDPTINAITWSPNGTIDYSLGNVFSLTVNSTGTLSESNLPPAGSEYFFRIILTRTGSPALTVPASWSKGMNIPTENGEYIIQGTTYDAGTSFWITVIYP